MKKVAVMTIVFLFILTLAMSGCSVKAGTPAEAPAPAAAEAAPATAEAAPAEAEEKSNLEKSLAIDISDVRGTDGQLLLEVRDTKDIPERPADPKALPETDPLRWYDMEYAGWSNTDKSKVVPSPADGCIGKKVVLIVTGDHPWTTAVIRGSEIAAEAYGMEIEVLNPNYDLNVQNQMIDQAINSRPDAIIIMFLDAEAAVQQARKVNEAGIPCFGSTMQPAEEALQYIVNFAGPDDFGQMAMLADYAAEKVGSKGGICYVTHLPGGSSYYARYNRFEAELAAKYPDIKTLDVATPGFDADATYQVVADWITRFGDELTMIQLSDDSAQMTGAVLACQDANRNDIIITAAGNSKTGMDMVKDGIATAITLQSAEGGGAICIKQCADWFNGLELPPVVYLPICVLDGSNVADYYPAQW